MKKLVLLSVVALMLGMGKPAEAGPVDANSILHFGGSAALNGTIYLFLTVFSGREQHNKLPALIGSTGFSLAYGLAIEVMDANGGYLDGADLAFDAAGVLISSALIYKFDILDKQDNLSISFTGKKIMVGFRF